MNIAYNSNLYVAIEGGSLINAMWCNPNAKIIEISLNKKYKQYNYSWKNILKSVGINIYKTIDISELNSSEGITEIFKQLKNL